MFQAGKKYDQICIATSDPHHAAGTHGSVYRLSLIPQEIAHYATLAGTGTAVYLYGVMEGIRDSEDSSLCEGELGLGVCQGSRPSQSHPRAGVQDYVAYRANLDPCSQGLEQDRPALIACGAAKEMPSSALPSI